MNIAKLRLTKCLLSYVSLINNVQRIQRSIPITSFYSTFTMEPFSIELLERQRNNGRGDKIVNPFHHCSDTSAKINFLTLNENDLDTLFTELITKNKDKRIQDIILEYQNHHKFISYTSLRKLFRHYSINGKPEIVVILQNYCAKVDINFYRRNGEFLHYLAKAQCMKGNSDKGLSILKDCYTRFEGLRSFYRIIFRELIQDSVLNRSEASLMVFKKYVLLFSSIWSDHYPLVCFWHICWASSWFSDQTLANDLLEESEVLQDIVRDKATAISIMALKDYNEDAVVRLLQILLKYDMMIEYAGVLEVLFNYKLKFRDIRGCTEIIKNCKALGINLPSDQQGRYIKMLIHNTTTNKAPTRRDPPKDFKLKF